MEIILSTVKDKKMQFNMMNNSQPAKNYCGIELVITGVVIYSDTDEETGEVKTITSFCTETGECYGSVSPNVREAFESINEVFGEVTPENTVTIELKMGKSANGRDFLSVLVI